MLAARSKSLDICEGLFSGHAAPWLWNNGVAGNGPSVVSMIVVINQTDPFGMDLVGYQ